MTRTIIAIKREKHLSLEDGEVTILEYMSGGWMRKRVYRDVSQATIDRIRTLYTVAILHSSSEFLAIDVDGYIQIWRKRVSTPR